MRTFSRQIPESFLNDLRRYFHLDKLSANMLFGRVVNHHQLGHDGLSSRTCTRTSGQCSKGSRFEGLLPGSSCNSGGVSVALYQGFVQCSCCRSSKG